MSDNTIRCGLDGCAIRQCANTGHHAWKGEIAVSGCLPTAIPWRTRYVSIWVEIEDDHREPDEIMVGLYLDPNGEDGVEARMTVEEAEHVYHLLGSAIRRHTAYGRVAQ